MTAKHVSGCCPTCLDPYPAEFALQGEPPRWSCTCGAAGSLIGNFSARKPTEESKPPSTVKPHWRDRGTT